MQRALIVDDDPAMQRTLAREVLKGYEVVLASSAQQATELIARGERLQAVVSKLELGSGVDGAAVLREAQSRLVASARILVTTSVHLDLARELIAAWTAHFVFMTPWDRGQIVRAIEEAIAFERGGPDAKTGVQLRSARIIAAAGMSRSG